MGFIVKVFTVKGNLVFMNNFYHKLAVASICATLSFPLGASEEAKAATFNSYFPYSLTFHAYDGGSFGSFDGLGDAVDSFGRPDPDSTGAFHSWYLVERTTTEESAALVEFSIPDLTWVSTGYRTDTRITNIISAILLVEGRDVVSDDSYHPLSLFGYVGNGTAEASDLEAGIFLGSSTGLTQDGRNIFSFNVTPFLNRLVSNNNEYAGFSLRSLTENTTFLMGYEGYSGRNFPPTLIVEGEYEVVPEPTTIFGSAIGLCLGGWLKRRKSISQNKAKSKA
jgi:hypothetical protein